MKTLSKKISLAFVVVIMTLIAAFALTTYNSNQAYASNLGVDVDTDPDVRLQDNAAQSNYWTLIMESSCVQASTPQCFTAETFKAGIRKLDNIEDQDFGIGLGAAKESSFVLWHMHM